MISETFSNEERVQRLEEASHEIRSPTYAMLKHTDPRGNRWFLQPEPGEAPLAAAKRLRRLVEEGPPPGSANFPCKFDQWTDAQGNTTTVSACQGAGESMQEFCDRFDALVRAMQEEFPCD